MSVINSCICLLVISQTQTHHHSPINTSGPPVTLYHCTSDSSSLKTLHHQSALVISILNRPVDGPSVNQWSINERLSDKAFDSPTVVHTMTWPNGLRHLQQNSWQHPLYVQLSVNQWSQHSVSQYCQWKAEWQGVRLTDDGTYDDMAKRLETPPAEQLTASFVRTTIYTLHNDTHKVQLSLTTPATFVVQVPHCFCMNSTVQQPSIHAVIIQTLSTVMLTQIKRW